MPEEKPIAYNAYQKLADAYAAKIDTKPHNAYYDRPAMLGLLPDVDGKRVLDAGCGPGVYAEALVERGAIVDSCDISERMLQLAGRRLISWIAAGKVTLHLLDLTKPFSLFEDARFDLVNAPLCLDYIEDWTSLFKEFYRVLKPGGYFQFSAGHPSFDAEYFRTTHYFSVERVECTWEGFDIEVNMPSYRRSLENALNPVIEAGFVIDRILEPQPTEDFRHADSRRYHLLMHRPGFLCVRARKQ